MLSTNIEVFLHIAYDYAGKNRSYYGLLESRKKIGGSGAFSGDNEATFIFKSSKILSNVWYFFPN